MKKAKVPLISLDNSLSDSNSLSKPKKVLFRIVMITLPIIILLLTEIGLRIFNYGGNLNLFVLNQSGDVKEYVLNSNFTNRYFFQKGIETVIPLSQSFTAEKGNNTYRIFCMGESSVQGFPYPPNASFPAVLKNILSAIHPDRNIEVVNCGITAISSYSVLDMSEEILDKYNPDLLVIYTGHNEFYGVFGQASRLSLFDSPGLTRLFLKLEHSKLFLLLRNTLTGIFGKDIGNDPSVHRGTFMGITAKDIGIRSTDEMMNTAAESFRENIGAIVDKAKDNNTKVLVCNLVSNLKDLPPLGSLHRRNLSKKDTVIWNGMIEKARYLRNNEQFKEAIEEYKSARKIDSTFAETEYELGLCCYENQNYDLAKKYFINARDLDVVRFRAPSSFNIILKDVCSNKKVPFVNIENGFEENSANGIIGNELLHEHVHPNQTGYMKMAQIIAKEMSENGLIEKEWDWSRNLPDSVYLAMSSLTLLDHEIVNYALYRLTSHWPFNYRQGNYSRIGNERTEILAREFVDQNKKSIVDLHVDYGVELQNQNDINGALAEYFSALAIQPASEIYNRIGGIYIAQTELAFRDKKDFVAAQEYYNTGFQFLAEGLKRFPDDLELNFNLGLLYVMRNDKLTSAVEQFQKVLSLDSKHQKTLKLLGDLYVRLNRNEDARDIFRKAIALYPKHAEFYTGLGMTLIKENRLADAEIYLKKAIEINEDPKAKYLISQLNIGMN